MHSAGQREFTLCTRQSQLDLDLYAPEWVSWSRSLAEGREGKADHQVLLTPNMEVDFSQCSTEGCFLIIDVGLLKFLPPLQKKLYNISDVIEGRQEFKRRNSPIE